MSTTPIKPCTSTTGKHAWGFVKNRRESSATINSRGTSVRMRLVGVFRCQHCPTVKIGTPRTEGGAA